MIDNRPETTEKKNFKRSAFTGVIPVMFIYYCGYVCVTKSNVANPSFFDTIAPYIGYACILLASGAAIAIIFRAFKEIKNKPE